MFKYILPALLSLSACILMPALANEAKSASRRTYESGDLGKRIAVVKMKSPPTIDGIMEPGEWENATRITGLTEAGVIFQAGVHGCVCVIDHPTLGRLKNIATNQSAFWVSYDDEYLYVAHLSPPPAGIRDNPAMIQVMLKRAQTLHDANIDQDDSISIEIMSPVYPDGDNYIIQVNSIGTTFDCIWGGAKGKMPGITVGWEPEVINKSTLTLDGWIIETAIPWKDFGPHIEKPAPGTVLPMNFGRIWREVTNEFHAWQAFDGFRPKGDVLFCGDEGVVVQLNDAGNLPRGQAKFDANLKNLSATEARVIAEVSTDSGDLNDRKELLLPPNQSVPYLFTGRITDLATTTIALTIKEATGGTIIHQTVLPVIRKTAPDIYTRRYRSRELVKFEVDMGFIGSADPAKTSIKLSITDNKNGKRIVNKTFKGFDSYDPVLELSSEGWAPADYTAKFVFTAPGMKAYEASIPYKHPQLPEWWNNRYGLEDLDYDRVPFPWTNVEVKDDAIQVWGRSYQFSEAFLPKQITTLDFPILRGPARLVIETADGKVLDTASATVEKQWTSTRRTRVEGERTIAADGFALRNALWAEYDGLLWNTLELKPDKTITVKSMELIIPLTREFTDVMNNMDYSLRTTGKLKPEGFVAPAARPLWLGNGDGGIQIAAKEDNQYFVQDIKKTMHVDMSADGAILRMVLVDVPTEFTAPYSVQIGLIATPVRPKLTRTPFFRQSSLVGGGAWYPQGMEFVAAADPGFDPYGYGTKAGRIYVHTAPVNVSPESMKMDAAGAEDYLFADEIRANPSDRSLDRINTDYESKVARDYFVWRHWRYQNKYGFKGLYYDGTGGVILGLRDLMRRLYNITLINQPYGAREANVGIHSSAMFNMAAYAFGTYNWDAENYNSIINETQQTYRGEVDPARFRAEHLGHNFGWPLYFLGQGRIKREWVEANGGPEAVFDQIYGLNLLHDGGGVCCILPTPMRDLEVRRAGDVKALGLHHWIYQFTPYWHQDIVALPHENMHASFYIARPSKLAATDPNDRSGEGHRVRTFTGYFDKHLPWYIKVANINETEDARAEFTGMKDRIIMVVYNDTAWEGEMRLKVDWQKLGLGTPDTLTATNALHRTGFRVEKVKDKDGKEVEKAVFFERPEEYARIENGELLFPMTPYNYRLIVIEQR
jgi:hypothetical protein